MTEFVTNFFINATHTGLLEVGRTTGQTVRRLFIPYWKAPGEEEPEVEGEGDDKDGRNTTSQEKGTDNKGGKGKNKDEGGKKGDKDKPKSAMKSGNKRRESQSSSKGDGKGVLMKDGKENGIEEEVKPVELNRHWFNYVCYGLPNLMVTQVS